MRLAPGQIVSLGLIVLVWAAIIAAIFFAVRGIIRYMRKREAQRQEMLELMRKQNHGEQNE